MFHGVVSDLCNKNYVLTKVSPSIPSLLIAVSLSLEIRAVPRHVGALDRLIIWHHFRTDIL